MPWMGGWRSKVHTLSKQLSIHYITLSLLSRGFIISWRGCYGSCPRHKPTKLAHSFLLCSYVYFCLYGPFNCISFLKLSRKLSAFSLCSSGPVLPYWSFELCLFMKVSLSPDIILCSWLGLKHLLTLSLTQSPTSLSPPLDCGYTWWKKRQQINTMCFPKPAPWKTPHSSLPTCRRKQHRWHFRNRSRGSSWQSRRSSSSASAECRQTQNLWGEMISWN